MTQLKEALEWQRPKGALDYLRLILRLGLGGVFVYLGLQKAMDPVAFLKVLREYDLTEIPWLLNGLAALLPWIEIFCGSLLVLGIAVRGTAALLGVLVVGFTAIVLSRALDIYASQSLAFCAIQFDCGCGSGVVYACRKLTENAVLMVMAIGLMLRGSNAARLRARS